MITDQITLSALVGRDMDVVKGESTRFVGKQRKRERFDFSEGDAVVEVWRYKGDKEWQLYIDLDPLGNATAKHTAAAQIVQDATRALLTLNRPRKSSAVDDAISLELRAIIADRGWTFREAAAMFGLTMSRLSQKLNGYSSWYAHEVLGIDMTVRLTDDPDADYASRYPLATAGFAAYRA